MEYPHPPDGDLDLHLGLTVDGRQSLLETFGVCSHIFDPEIQVQVQVEAIQTLGAFTAMPSGWLGTSRRAII